MEARLLRVVFLTAALVSLGASHRSENFIVSAPTPALAKKICDTAEMCRKDLAIEWLGKEMPPWGRPCPITAKVAPNLGAGGVTSFVFQSGEVYKWEMSIQGSEERILDSVLPHEVTHTIFASHFRRPLPRWADEGACTTVEHPSEKARHREMLISFLKTNRGIAVSRLFAIKEYPKDVLPLYAEGFSIARYLIDRGGKQKFLKFIGDGMNSEDWPRTTQQHYGFDNLASLQNNWLNWVRQGSPEQAPETNPGRTAAAGLLASTSQPRGTTPGATQASFTSASTGASKGDAAAPLAKVNQQAPARPPSRYQAVRQQPLQRPQQRLLR